MASKPALPQITETEWLNQVIQTARLFGWRTAHFRAAKTNKGWRTPVGGDGMGWPDLVLVKPGRGVLFVELKSARGKLRPDQEEWRDCLLAAGCDWRLWYPGNWEEAVKVLRGKEEI